VNIGASYTHYYFGMNIVAGVETITYRTLTPVSNGGLINVADGYFTS
jgi:hypothetical protein